MFWIGIGTRVMGQGSPEYGQGMKIQLNESGSKYIRIALWNQIWTRVVEQNPGSMVNGKPQTHTWDVGARRLRMMFYSQIGPRYLVMAHIGVNNQTFATGGSSGATGTGGYGSGKKPGLFFHDAYNEYAVFPTINPKTGENSKFTLYVGAGLHNWYGLARQSSGSTQNTLASDLPLINFALSEFSDQFNRQFGIYAKGRVGKASYRLSVNKPFATNQTPAFDTLRGQVAVDNNGAVKPGLQGYFDYQFLDQEADVLPFRVGTYVGTKKVLNVGAGFYHEAAGTESMRANGDVIQHPINLFAADVFADLPFGGDRNMAVTFLSSYYHFGFGPNYIRTLGVMNTATGWDPSFPISDRPLNGFGNNRFFVGTGNAVYTQAGFLLPKSLSRKIRLQPFAAHTYKKLEYLGQGGHYWDLGANVFIDGHQAKLTPQWSLRPLYYQTSSGVERRGNASEFLVQFQVCL